MTIEKILDKAVEYAAGGFPFVIYAKPGWKKVRALFQTSNFDIDHEHRGEAGFVFNTFDSSQKLIIPFNSSEVHSANFHVTEALAPISSKAVTADIAFTSLIEKALEAIQLGDVQKVVLSRFEEVSLNGNAHDIIYKRLLFEYETAFRYWFFHPQVGTWMGATPEKLLSVKENSFEVMSLAGTRMAGTDINWGAKEQIEQQWVTDYIISSVTPNVTSYAASEPYTHLAGTLEHLRTDISGFISKSKVADLIALLHPTPAVCGFPKEKAKKLLAEIEGYNREFYTGFLGLYDDFDYGEPQTDLYVNLRCMKLYCNKAILYVGCGITEQSDPIAEYTETINKSMTIKKVLQ